MVELAVRLVFSLAVVVGLLLLTVKVGSRKFRPRNGAAVRIVHRQALSRGTAVAVVEVGSRVLVLGTTEHQVNVLAELDEGELDDDAGEPVDLSLVDDLLEPASQVIALEEVRDAQPIALEVAPSTGTGTARTRRGGSHAARPAPKRRAGGKGARKAAPTRPTRPARAARTAEHGGALAGSVLSPQTWRQALAAASGRAS